MVPCLAVTVRALSYMNSWCGKRRPESRRRVESEWSQAACLPSSCLQWRSVTTGQDRRPGTSQEGQTWRSPVQPGPASCLCVCRTPTGLTRSLFGQSGLAQSVWPQGSWLGISRRWESLARLVAAAPTGFNLKEEKWEMFVSPQTSSLGVGSNTKYKEMVCKFYPIKPQRRLNWTRINLHHWPSSTKNQI